MAERQPIIPPGVSPNPNLSPGIRVGDFLFVSGHVGTDASGNVAVGDCEAQSRQVMANIRGVVEAAGGRMEDVVKDHLLPDQHRRLRRLRQSPPGNLAQRPARQLDRRR